MPPPNDALLKRLLATFQVEAEEHAEAMALGLVNLEKASTDETRAALLDGIFRNAHSLKGAARAVNLLQIEKLCQAIEGVFATLKKGGVAPSPALFDLLHQAVDALTTLLGFLHAEPPQDIKLRVTELVKALQAPPTAKPASPVSPPPQTQPPAPHPAIPQAPVAPPLAAIPVTVEVPVQPKIESPQPPVEEKRHAVETVRVSTAKLDAVLRQSEELLMAKQSATQRVGKLREVQRGHAEWKKKWSKLRPDARLLQKMLEKEGEDKSAISPQIARLLEFLEWNRNFIEALDSELTGLTQSAALDQRMVGGMIDNLLDEMKKVVMQPFSTLLDLFPRIVRELSRELGKEVELSIYGGAIEMDRRILEEMKDPLVHLVRNCLDHGMENPDERRRKAKPAQGKITIGISTKSGNHVELLISDDGSGIDVEKVKTAARKSRLLSAEKAETLNEVEALTYIFQSGFSTSPLVTDISGRGLGLAIVKEKVEKLNGTLAVETKLGRGTTFRLVLPLTIARFQGVMVRVEEQFFILPTSNVERVARIKRTEVKTVENRETIALNGEAMSLAHLREVLSLTAKNSPDKPAETVPVIVLSSADQRIAFVVAEVLQEHEVLVKSLGRQLVRINHLAGATVLGTGKVVPILHVPDLIKTAIRVSGSGLSALAPREENTSGPGKSILVAEDSITSRTLLKNILETAGYRVETSVDGVDALTKLRTGTYDLVVSDVDMPRMNGFGLTSKIRADKKFAELPVILVTSLDSRSDREHGIDVGANAYIVKGSFDQSNLLEVVGRLI